MSATPECRRCHRGVSGMTGPLDGSSGRGKCDTDLSLERRWTEAIGQFATCPNAQLDRLAAKEVGPHPSNDARGIANHGASGHRCGGPAHVLFKDTSSDTESRLVSQLSRNCVRASVAW